MEGTEAMNESERKRLKSTDGAGVMEEPDEVMVECLDGSEGLVEGSNRAGNPGWRESLEMAYLDFTPIAIPN